MSVRRVATCRSRWQLLRTAAATAVAALAPPALAAPASLLEVTVGPHETSWLEAKELKVRLDGAPLAVSVPAPRADPALPITSEVIAPGKHTVEVEAGFVGNSEAFNYVQGYVFRMNGQLEIDASVGQAVVLNVRVVTRSGLTIEWTDKFKLALKARAVQSERAAAAQLPDAAPPAVAAAEPPAPAAPPDDVEKPPAPEPTPAVFVQRQGAGACTLEPPHFRFARHELDAPERARLDRFASCLRESGDAVLVEGHTDPIGSAQYNDWLSAERAATVVDYLVGQGVSRSRLATKAYGFTRPVCTEKTRGCHARNRRAEAIVSQP